jgi:hypothetical protein
MNRYQIAVRKHQDRKVVMFKASDRIDTVCKYIAYCVKSGLVFHAKNIPRGVLDASVIAYSKRVNIPILMTGAVEVMTLSTAYSHREIYTKESLPKNCTAVILYGCPITLIKSPLKATVVIEN